MRRDPNFLIMARSDILAVEVIEAAQDRARSWWRPAAPHLQGGVEELVQFQATSEGYEALERGVIDCPLQSTANGYNAGWLEVAPSSRCRERQLRTRPRAGCPTTALAGGSVFLLHADTRPLVKHRPPPFPTRG